MRKLLSVKMVLLIKFILFTQLALADMKVIPHFRCGEYVVEGKLLFANSGDFLLRLRDSSSSPFELILLGGDVEKKLSLANSQIKVKISVEKEIKSNNSPFVHFLDFSTEKIEKNEDYKLLKEKKCQN